MTKERSYSPHSLPSSPSTLTGRGPDREICREGHSRIFTEFLSCHCGAVLHRTIYPATWGGGKAGG